MTYSLPINAPGKYVLVLKFSEVYFNSPGEKVFNINIGNESIIKNVDIYHKVGKAAAYDEFIPFEIKNNAVYVNVRLSFNVFRTELLKMDMIKKKDK